MRAKSDRHHPVSKPASLLQKRLMAQVDAVEVPHNGAFGRQPGASLQKA